MCSVQFCTDRYRIICAVMNFMCADIEFTDVAVCNMYPMKTKQLWYKEGQSLLGRLGCWLLLCWGLLLGWRLAHSDTLEDNSARLTSCRKPLT